MLGKNILKKSFNLLLLKNSVTSRQEYDPKKLKDSINFLVLKFKILKHLIL